MGDINLNRRRYKRYTLNVKLFMTRVDDDKGIGIPVEVLDISTAGVGFFCEQELMNGVIYKANIKIWTGDVIPAFINVVRVSRQEDGYIYGGIFIGMPESDSCRIAVYETYQENTDGAGNPPKTEEEERDELMSIMDQALNFEM
ncbi:MAG: PilZ domain-containing protein [Lachnospiraceae bacterium]|nr:PilZ domain-containing protein [Lachnospiraceae bacterium]